MLPRRIQNQIFFFLMEQGVWFLLLSTVLMIGLNLYLAK